MCNSSTSRHWYRCRMSCGSQSQTSPLTLASQGSFTMQVSGRYDGNVLLRIVCFCACTRVCTGTEISCNLVFLLLFFLHVCRSVFVIGQREIKHCRLLINNKLHNKLQYTLLLFVLFFYTASRFNGSILQLIKQHFLLPHSDFFLHPSIMLC